MTNIIHEDKSVNADNFAFLLAQSNYNLSSVFRSRNHNETIADSPMTSSDGIPISKYTITHNDLPEKQSRNHQFQFKLLSASTNQIADLKDAEINVVASVYSHAVDTGKSITLDYVPRLGNQALLSLFSSIELYIDSTLIERIDYPGFSSNADYALRYPHNTISEKLLESNGFISKLKDIQSIKVETKSDNTTSITNVVPLYDDGIYDYSNSSVTWELITPTGAGATTYLHGVISQRIKLSDIFPCINTLPPIFNHSVIVNFARNSENRIIASSYYKDDIKDIITELHAFVDFKIYQDCYIITDELKKAATAYYSKPIETIFTKCKQLSVGLPTAPQRDNTMSFNISIDTAYKNKLVVFAIPRTTNFTNQPMSYTKRRSTDKNYNYKLKTTYDVASAPANSYTHGGLKNFTVYTMNGIKLLSFDMSRDGYKKGLFEEHDKLGMLNTKQTENEGASRDIQEIENYQSVYQEYLKAREQFGQLREEGLDYETFIKEYCIFCVDLSPFSFGSGENLRVEMVFDSWADNYNPYCKNNDGTSTTISNYYISKNIYCLFYSDKVLRLLPNQNVELGDLFQIKTETDETNMI